MRFLLLLVFVIGVKGETITTGLTTTAGTEVHKNVIGPIEDNKSEASKKRVAKFARNYGVGLEANEDDVTNEENFVRPCHFDDMECIRKFFTENSKCKPAYGKIKEPFYLAQNTEIFPFLNLTITDSNFTITGLSNYEIIEFFYNEVTCKLVIALKIKNLIEAAPLAYFSYQRTAKESIVLADCVNLFTKTLIITVVIPQIPELCLELAQAHIYISDANPVNEIGPKAYTSNDPDVQEAYADLLKFLPIILRERTLFKAELFAALIIQKTICDFGVDLYRL